MRFFRHTSDQKFGRQVCHFEIIGAFSGAKSKSQARRSAMPAAAARTAYKQKRKQAEEGTRGPAQQF